VEKPHPFWHPIAALFSRVETRATLLAVGSRGLFQAALIEKGRAQSFQLGNCVRILALCSVSDGGRNGLQRVIPVSGFGIERGTIDRRGLFEFCSEFLGGFDAFDVSCGNEVFRSVLRIRVRAPRSIGK
jgi:hypothetical protein